MFMIFVSNNIFSSRCRCCRWSFIQCRPWSFHRTLGDCQHPGPSFHWGHSIWSCRWCWTPTTPTWHGSTSTSPRWTTTSTPTTSSTPTLCSTPSSPTPACGYARRCSSWGRTKTEKSAANGRWSSQPSWCHQKCRSGVSIPFLDNLSTDHCFSISSQIWNKFPRSRWYLICTKQKSDLKQKQESFWETQISEKSSILMSGCWHILR